MWTLLSRSHQTPIYIWLDDNSNNNVHSEWKLMHSKTLLLRNKSTIYILVVYTYNEFLLRGGENWQYKSIGSASSRYRHKPMATTSPNPYLYTFNRWLRNPYILHWLRLTSSHQSLVALQREKLFNNERTNSIARPVDFVFAQIGHNAAKQCILHGDCLAHFYRSI